MGDETEVSATNRKVLRNKAYKATISMVVTIHPTLQNEHVLAYPYGDDNDHYYHPLAGPLR